MMDVMKHEEQVTRRDAYALHVVVPAVAGLVSATGVVGFFVEPVMTPVSMILLSTMWSLWWALRWAAYAEDVRRIERRMRWRSELHRPERSSVTGLPHDVAELADARADVARWRMRCLVGCGVTCVGLLASPFLTPA